MKQNSKTNTRQLVQIFKLIWPYKGYLSCGFLALFVTTACMLALPQYLKQVFDESLQTGSLENLNQLILVSFGTVLVLSAGVLARTFFIQYTGGVVVGRFRERVFSHILRFDISFFETFGTGEVVSRLQGDIVVIRQFIQFALPALLRGVLLAFGSSILLFFTNTKLMLILCLVGAPIVITAFVLGKTWKQYSKQIQNFAANLSGQAEEAIYAIRTVRACNQKDATEQKYHLTMNETIAVAKRLILSEGAFFSFSLLIAFSGILLVLWLGGRDVIQGNMSLGDMMSFLLYLAFLGDGVGSLGQFWPALQNAAGATERVFELLAEKPHITEVETTRNLPKAEKGRQVEFQKVGFHYASRPDSAALSNLNLTVQAGETVAIVGPSGAGKSTLLSLLLRFYDPQTGQILLDGLPIKELSFADLRNAVGLVAQDATVFSTTVGENIAYGRPEATEEDIIQAAKAAHAHDFIMALPKGYQTEVGEKGVRLSGGQKQRVALARTILRNPSVLLLDEATSHLDAESEHAVQQALEELRQDRTTLVVAHRLSTVQAANRIIVLDGGKIVAEGTHKELIKTCDLYKKLAELQFLG